LEINMNRIATQLITATVLGCAVFAAQAATSVKATVNGMVCAFCAQGIEKRMTKLPATKAVFVSLDNKVVAIEAKDGQSLDEKLIASEIKDAGYDVVKIETVQQSVADIKATVIKK
jgi:mercuric ion binding protein